MTGCWIFVVGPSGAGKDSIIHSAQQMLAGRKNIIFTRRLVTRPSVAGSEHDSVSEQDFSRLTASGGLNWHWQAHGFFYGIAAKYAAAVQSGHLVVVNGSRAHVNALLPAEDIKIIEVSAHKNKLASRLQQRGRDDLTAIAGRLVRNSSIGPVRADFVIVNDGALAESGQRLADYLIAVAQPFKQ